jgi:CTP:molybdopterin cytidylyltransferase MocA
MEAIVLAGGNSDDPLALKYSVPTKSLVPYKNRPLVEYTLEALDALALPIHCVGITSPLRPEPLQQLPDQGSLLANLEAAVKATSAARLLVATGDMPLLTAAAVRWIIDNAPEAGFVYTVVEKSVIERLAPSKRTYARVREGTFTGGNIFLVERELFFTSLPLLKRALELRKQPLALAQMIGLSTLMRVTMGKATIAELEGKISSMLGASAKALITPYAEVGIDLDHESDLAWLQNK